MASATSPVNVKRSKTSVNFSEKKPQLADDGLNFLLLLVDVQVLFDAALGLYDFDLVS